MAIVFTTPQLVISLVVIAIAAAFWVIVDRYFRHETDIGD